MKIIISVYKKVRFVVYSTIILFLVLCIVVVVSIPEETRVQMLIKWIDIKSKLKQQVGRLNREQARLRRKISR